MTIEKMPAMTGTETAFSPRSPSLAVRKPSRSTDAVAVSQDTLDIRLLTAQATHTHADIDHHRVNPLQQAIAQGHYRIHPGRIADALINLTQGEFDE